MQSTKNLFLFLFALVLFISCADDAPDELLSDEQQSGADDSSINFDYPAISGTFGSTIDPDNLANYASQSIPDYIILDNTRNNEISDEGAALGRVLFYDVNLSADNSISCASCHQQEFAFGDPENLSLGVAGTTGRHSMRLVNPRFGAERRFFWDERAPSLEAQTTMPIQDHIEMGFSGENGDPSFEDLIVKLRAIDYYEELFTLAYGNANITENRIQRALAQFIRSIQSFDTKYDAGRSLVNTDVDDFQNFTEQENQGKQLFMQRPRFQRGTSIRNGGGLGCDACHRAPEFSIIRNSGNNGVIHTAAGLDSRDLTVTRSPSLRDIFNESGDLNGPLMHTGTFETIDMVLDHYNDLRPNNNAELDNRLARGGGVQLNMTPQEREALIAFLKTLSGSDMYENEKWSNPF